MDSDKRYETRGVLAGAYRDQSLKALLTHTVEIVDGSSKAICTRVKEENLADACSGTEEEAAEPPTCTICRRRDPRFK